MARGTFRRLLEQQGFGYIETENGHSLFFHSSDVLQIPFEALQQGDLVEFTLEATRQGPRARHVSVIESGSTAHGDNQ